MNPYEEDKFPEDFDPDDFEFDPESDDGVHSMMFVVSPGGVTNQLSPTQIPNFLSHLFDQIGLSYDKKVPILNYEYLIEPISEIEGSVLFLECYRNKNSKTSNYTLLDAYDYLRTSQFLNFYLSLKFGATCANMNMIDIKVHLDRVTNVEKILILYEVHEMKYLDITDLNLTTYECTTDFSVKSIDARTSVFTNAYLYKSNSSPITFFKILFTTPNNNNLNFSSFNIAMFYDLIIKEYVNKMMQIFYPDKAYNVNHARASSQSLGINFYIAGNDKILEVLMIGVPKLFQFQDNKYLFDNLNNSIILSPMLSEQRVDYSDIDVEALASFMNRISSTANSQVITCDYNFMGYATHLGKRSITISKKQMYFSNSTLYLDTISPESKVHVVEEVKSNNNVVCNYWKLPEKILFKQAGGKTTVKYHGFINCCMRNATMTYSELILLIYDELNDIFKINAANLLNKKKLIVSECFRNDSIVRLLIGEIISTKETENMDSEDRKPIHKKFKFFN